MTTHTRRLTSVSKDNTAYQTPMPWARGERRQEMIDRRNQELIEAVKSSMAERGT